MAVYLTKKLSQNKTARGGAGADYSMIRGIWEEKKMIPALKQYNSKVILAHYGG